MAPRAGLEPATCGLQRLRVGLSHHPRHDPLGCRALMGAYCLGCSPPSLCTFPPTSCPSAGLAQDSSRRTFPEFTRFSFTGFPVMLPFDSPSLYQLSYRGSNLKLSPNGSKTFLPRLSNAAMTCDWVTSPTDLLFRKCFTSASIAESGGGQRGKLLGAAIQTRRC